MAHEPEHIPPQDTARDQLLERPLPNTAEAERAILGAIILDNGLIAQAAETLVPEDFYVPSHRRIFLAMIALFEKGSDINPILIGEELKKEGQLESVGGITFVSNLMMGLPHFANLDWYAKAVTDKSILRQIVKLCQKITSQALEEEDEPQVVLEGLSKGTFAIATRTNTKGFITVGSLVHKNLQKAHAIQQQGTAITGLATGLIDFDSQTLGLQRTDSIVIAARPSMGKTALAVQIATTAAIESGAKVAFFSLEMSEEQIGIRILCGLARVNSQKFRSGHLSVEEWDRLHEAEQKLANAKIFIDDTPGITTLQMRAKLRRLSIEHGQLDLSLVDYIQLMSNSSPSRYTDSRQQEITQISRELKAIAKEMNVPKILLSQLSRAPENRTDHRPILSDLRESGAIEQDADLVAFIYREDKYKTITDVSQLSHTAEIILAKQRNGPTGPNLFRFDETTGRFDNLHQGYH